MNINLEKYLHHVQRFDLTKDQQLELLATIWAVVEMVVDRSFEADPQQSLDTQKLFPALREAFHGAHDKNNKQATPLVDGQKGPTL